MKFEREFRYYVAKSKDVIKHLTSEEQQILSVLLDKVALGRLSDKKTELRCVVVESDWPEYEPVWGMIQKRIENSESVVTTTNIDDNNTNSLLLEAYRACQSGIMSNDLTKRILEHIAKTKA